jgi:hypothetical protein
MVGVDMLAAVGSVFIISEFIAVCALRLTR